MKPTEAAALLTIAAAFDNRKPDEDQAKAWALALDGLRFEDCREAIVGHYRATRDWLMPSDIIARVKALRSTRIMAYGAIEPPPELDPSDTHAYTAWIDQARRDIADGNPPPKPVELERRHDVIAELGLAGRAIPGA